MRRQLIQEVLALGHAEDEVSDGAVQPAAPDGGRVIAPADREDETSEHELVEAPLADFFRGLVMVLGHEALRGPPPDQARPADFFLLGECSEILQAALLLRGQHAVAEGHHLFPVGLIVFLRQLLVQVLQLLLLVGRVIRGGVESTKEHPD